MKTRSYLVIVAAAFLQSFSTLAAADHIDDGDYNCLPDCKAESAKFIALAGPELATLEGQTLNIQIGVSSAQESFEIGIFDGDTGTNWDSGTVAAEYELWADPTADGTGSSFLVGKWTGNVANPTTDTINVPALWSTNAASPPDDGWFEITVQTSSQAQNAASGDYLYRLAIRLVDPTIPGVRSNFKLRSTGTLAIKPFAVSFISAFSTLHDLETLYPNLDLLLPPDQWDFSGSPYNGDWRFYFFVDANNPAVTVWDGDFDFGAADLSTADTDDPDTPVTLPPFLAGLPNIATEGVALGVGGATGDPPDDLTGNDFFVRSPSVIYSVTDPNNLEFVNANPSGNTEWEQFLLSLDPAATRADADYAPSVSSDGSTFVNELPAGIWKLDVHGLDVLNLNAFRLEHDLLCTTADGHPCQPPTKCVPAVLNFEGDSTSTPLAAGTVIAEQWAAQGVHLSTGDPVLHPLMIFDTATPTGGELDLGTPNQDFGGPGIGTGGGLGSPGENSLARGKVLIISEDADGTDPDASAAGGTVTFTFDEPARVDSIGLLDIEAPGTVVNTYDADGNLISSVNVPALGDNSFQLVPVSAFGVSRLDVVLTSDAALTRLIYCQGSGSIGDYVWRDSNGNGVQESGEPGLAGVVVQLRDPSGNVLATTTTDAGGMYLFDYLPGGTYVVAVDPATLPPGLTPTYDYDGVASANRAALDLDAGGSNLDVDFGYNTAAGGQGCTPGYWKQPHHFFAWSGYEPDDSFDSVFGVDASGDKTLLDALTTGGGGEDALGRHAVAALLNAATGDVSYLYSEADVIALVQQAYASNDFESAKNLLAEQNEAGCPLGNGRNSGYSNDREKDNKESRRGQKQGKDSKKGRHDRD